MITLEKAREITQLKVASLKDDFQQRVKEWILECRDNGIEPYVYEGYRTNERQNELYAQGRTKSGPIVTNARAGQSFHNYGRAVDWVPLVPHDKVAGMFEAGWNQDKIYDKGNALARKHQLRYLSWETPHLEDATFDSWKELS